MKIKFYFLALSLLVLGACGKEDETSEEEEVVENPTFTAPYYFHAIIDGVDVTYQHGVNYYMNWCSTSSSNCFEGRQAEEAIYLCKYNTTNNQAGIMMVKAFKEDPSLDEIKAMFAVKSYSYGKDVSSSTEKSIDGVVVYYVDNDGAIWSSDYTPGTQTGSTFTITERVDSGTGFQPTYTVTANFKCTLYNGLGRAKTLTNGVLKGAKANYE